MLKLLKLVFEIGSWRISFCSIFSPESHFEHLPDLSDDEEQDTDGQQQYVVGQLAVIDGADDDPVSGLLGHDVEDAVLVGQRYEQNNDKNLAKKNNVTSTT